MRIEVTIKTGPLMVTAWGNTEGEAFERAQRLLRELARRRTGGDDESFTVDNQPGSCDDIGAVGVEAAPPRQLTPPLERR